MLPKEQLPKSHIFNGKKYKFKWRKPRKALGSCDNPKEKAYRRFIFVDLGRPPKEITEILIHEALHAEQWYLDEETVGRIALNLSELLERCGLINK
jgi:hypothetical protein